jgi:hypothetical protein
MLPCPTHLVHGEDEIARLYDTLAQYANLPASFSPAFAYHNFPLSLGQSDFPPARTIQFDRGSTRGGIIVKAASRILVIRLPGPRDAPWARSTDISFLLSSYSNHPAHWVRPSAPQTLNDRQQAEVHRQIKSG